MRYNYRQDLAAEGCIDPLKMALNNRFYNQQIIHHSDIGSQYCSRNYVSLLMKNKISNSMTENGDPYKNALAERVNRIIKTEFNLNGSSLGFEQTGNQITKSINSYNELRPQASCDYLKPNQAHLCSGKINKRW
jgi:transposase InsO family protein